MYPQGIGSKTSSRCLKLQVTLSTIYTMFYSYIYTPMIKFNL